MNGCSGIDKLIGRAVAYGTQATDRPWGIGGRIHWVRVCDHNALLLPMSSGRLCGSVALTDADAGIGNSSNVSRPRPHHCTGSNHQAASGSASSIRQRPSPSAGSRRQGAGSKRQEADGRWLQLMVDASTSPYWNLLHYAVGRLLFRMLGNVLARRHCTWLSTKLFCSKLSRLLVAVVVVSLVLFLRLLFAAFFSYLLFLFFVIFFWIVALHFEVTAAADLPRTSWLAKGHVAVIKFVWLEGVEAL